MSSGSRGRRSTRTGWSFRRTRRIHASAVMRSLMGLPTWAPVCLLCPQRLNIADDRNRERFRWRSRQYHAGWELQEGRLQVQAHAAAAGAHCCQARCRRGQNLVNGSHTCSKKHGLACEVKLPVILLRPPDIIEHQGPTSVFKESAHSTFSAVHGVFQNCRPSLSTILCCETWCFRSSRDIFPIFAVPRQTTIPPPSTTISAPLI